MNTSQPDPLPQPFDPPLQPFYPPPPPRAGEGLGIAAFVCAFFVPILGVIFGHVSRGQSKRAHQSPTGLATAGCILGWIFTVLGVLLIVLFALAAAKAGNSIPATYPTR